MIHVKSTLHRMCVPPPEAKIDDKDLEENCCQRMARIEGILQGRFWRIKFEEINRETWNKYRSHAVIITHNSSWTCVGTETAQIQTCKGV